MPSTPIHVIGRQPQVMFEKCDDGYGPPKPLTAGLSIFQLTASVLYDSSWFTLILEQQGRDVPWEGERRTAVARELQMEMWRERRWLVETDIGPLRGHVEWHAMPGLGWECRLRYPTVNDGARMVLPIYYR